VITAPHGWVRHHGVHLVTLYPPEGGGRIRCYERVRPLRRMSELVTFVVERDPAFRIAAVRDAAPLVTSEGEHGAWVRVVGTRDGAPSTRFVGAVFAEDFAAVIDALVVDPARTGRLEAIASELVLGLSLGLGVRRRRYLYQPPAGWRALPSGLVAHWYPPGFPSDPTTLAVAPAEPSSDGVSAVFEGFLASEVERGHALDGPYDDAELVTDAGLRGRRWSMAMRTAGPGEPSYRDLAAFAAPPYAYSMRMETGAGRLAEHRATFTAVARTIAPVPAPGERHAMALATPPADLFAYLLD
jgi:hypothetical protein